MDRRASSCVPRIRALVGKLKKIEVDKASCDHHVIPLLHTLYHELLQSDHIPDTLLREVCDCFSRMLSEPEPCSSVSLKHLRAVRAELNTPGALFQRRLIAEQNLKTPHCSLQERVFVFADPLVVWGPLAASLRANLELVGASREPRALERQLLLHTFQTGLGEACHIPTLATALEGLGTDVLSYLQQVVLAVEQEHVEDSHGQYRIRLLEIYQDILSKTPPGSLSPCLPCGPLPHPDLSFHLWNQEEELWNVLAKFALNIPSAEEEEEDQKWRDSILSLDSGIEKDLAEMEEGNDGKQKEQRPSFTRSPCINRGLRCRDRLALLKGSVHGEMCSTMLPREESGRTAKVVVMGDDRVLGRLARTYLALRKRESKRVTLTGKVDLQMYYIPISDEFSASTYSGWSSGTAGRLSLATFLGRLDHMYHTHIYSLGANISHSSSTGSNHCASLEPDMFLLDVISYYLRCGIQTVYLPIYSVKIYLSGLQGVQEEEVFVSHLQVEFPEIRQRLQGASKRRVSEDMFGVMVSVDYKKVSLSKREVVKCTSAMAWGMEVTFVPSNQKGMDCLTARFLGASTGVSTEIRSHSISIRTQEERTFNVCLDRDSRRTFTNVQSLSISACEDPAYSVQSQARNSTTGEEVGLNKYLSKDLLLPINTFMGVSH